METAVNRRIRLLLAFVLLFAAGIGIKLVFLQVVRSDALRARAAGQHKREIEVAATRGAILDRKGRELAMSLRTESLFAHPHRVEHPEAAAEMLAPIIGVSRNKLVERLRSGKPFVYLHRFLEPEQSSAVRELDLPVGRNKPFGFLPSSKRYYPRSKLGVHVVGFAGVDGVGIEGIEQRFETQLRGDPTVYLVMQDGLAERVQQSVIRAPRKQPQDVVLTIDLVLQHIVERELDRALRETGAGAASAVLMDPATGQVLALANRPTANANRYGKASDAAKINRALVHQYEPGSTFKIVPMAAALERGTVRPNQLFDCERGSWVFRKRRIKDWKSFEILSAQQVIERSSNIGMVKIVNGLNSASLRATIDAFGFGKRTGIELPGETRGSIQPVSSWSAQTKPSLSFGYEIGVTVLQMATSVAVIANDGVRVPPRVVLGIREADGRFHRFAAPTAERAISVRTAREVSSMLEGVVTHGTGVRAQVPGYRLAGKSGTAKKFVDGRYSDDQYIGSFGGYGPVSAPMLVGFVVLDTPRGEHYYGGHVAAPVFQRIMRDALSYLRAPGDEDFLALAPNRVAAAKKGDRGRGEDLLR